MSVAVLMPVYNDEAGLARTVRALADRAHAFGDVTLYLVDDGSETPVELDTLAAPTRHFRVVFARHAVNLGQGAALETARQLALADGAAHDAYLTMDADGQHGVDDALTLARAVREGADVALGNRFLGSSNVPRGRRILLHAARLFEWALTGLRLADAHNGLRGLSRNALERIPLRQNRMAHATEITVRISHAADLRLVEVPVSLRYTRDAMAKGQSSWGAFLILHDLIAQYLFGELE